MVKPSPGVYFWPYPVFQAVGYGEIQWDTVRYTGRYERIQLDTVRRYSGSACCKMDIDIESIQGYTGYQGYGEIQAGYR